jgi:hypothetical protein
MFQGAFSKTFPSSFGEYATVAAAPWYLSGSIAAATCLAAYQPKGAASLAASYDNLAAPGNGLADGTYDCTLGVAPTWDVVSGWIFGGTQWLNTSVINQGGWSLIIKFSNITNSGGLSGSYSDFNKRFILQPNYVPWSAVIYQNGGYLVVAPVITAGVLALAGQQGYRNGFIDGGTIPAWSGVNSVTVKIGAMENGDAPIKGNIQAEAIYNTTLTPAQVLAVTNAMNLL